MVGDHHPTDLQDADLLWFGQRTVWWANRDRQASRGVPARCWGGRAVRYGWGSITDQVQTELLARQLLRSARTAALSETIDWAGWLPAKGDKARHDQQDHDAYDRTNVLEQCS
jgi:hypothetical protein